jgi:hypothetical protein
MIPTTEHNETLAGDTLCSVSFNYQWREIVVAALSSNMAYLASTIEDDNDRDEFEYRVGVMIEDFYSAEGIDMAVFLEASRSDDLTISGAQSDFPIVWNVGNFDATNQSRVYIPQTGIYTITGNAWISASVVRLCDLYLQVNGTTRIAAEHFSTGQERAHSIARVYPLNAGDYVELLAETNGTVTLDFDELAPALSLVGNLP